MGQVPQVRLSRRSWALTQGGETLQKVCRGSQAPTHST